MFRGETNDGPLMGSIAKVKKMAGEIDQEAQTCAQEMARKRDERLNSKQDTLNANQDTFSANQHALFQVTHRIEDEQTRQARLFEALYIQFCSNPSLDPRTRRPFASLVYDMETDVPALERRAKKARRKAKARIIVEASPPLPKDEGELQLYISHRQLTHILTRYHRGPSPRHSTLRL